VSAPTLYHSALMSRVPGVAHAFTGRGRPERDLGDLRGRSRSEVLDLWGEVAAPLGAEPTQVVILRQVHGNLVVEVDAPSGPFEPVAEADALFTTAFGVVLAVRTADCVPILLAGPGGVAAVHAGWRGVVAGVLPAAISWMTDRLNCPAERIVAAIGPHAGVAAYETGPEVIDAMVEAGLPRSIVACSGGGGREHAHLEAAVRFQCAALGVTQVDRVPGCTITDEESFFSHRRGDGGRQAALIARLGPDVGTNR
jgi:YfiH family protein